MEEITIKLFSAGPIKLEEQRRIVNSLAKKIEDDYKRLNHNVSIVTHSHDTSIFDKDQDKYDQFIEDEADLVLFFWGESMKDEPKDETGTEDKNDKKETWTEHEYKIAAKQYKDKGKPKFSVFVKNGEKPTVIKELEGLMLDSKVYYTSYNGDEDLEFKVREKIENIVNKRLAEKSKEVITKKNRNIRGLGILSTLAALLALAIGGFAYHQHKNAATPSGQLVTTVTAADTMLVLAGGGSVVNCIESEMYHDTIRSYPNSIYVNMPSGNAWPLLVEEACKDASKRTFNTICFSADKLDTTLIKSKINEKKDKARIIELKLDQEDPLVVYMNTDLAKEKGFKNKSNIDVVELVSVLKEINNSTKQSVRLFSTSRNSGTLRTYQQAINKIDSTFRIDNLFDKKICYSFFDSSTSRYIKYLINEDYKSYIILGSKYYYPTDLEKGEYIGLNLKFNHDDIKKSMYIYFAATQGDKDNQWQVDHHIIDFLKKIGAKRIINDKIWDNLNNYSSIKIDGDTIYNINKKR